MNTSNMDLNLFKVFNVIYLEGSITKAAETLGITQPAVSNSLSRLRMLFDDELFTRTNRGMRPTPLAQNIHPSIASALKLLRSSINESDVFRPATSNVTFNVCINATAQVSVVPQLISQLQSEAPHIKLSTQSIFCPDLVKALSSETVSLAVDYAIPSPDYIKRELLLNDDYVCIVRKNHPRIKDKLSLKQFESEQHLLLTEEAPESSNLRTALEENNIIQNTVFTGNEHIALPAIIVTSNTIMTVTRTFANAVSNYLDISILEPPFNIASRKTFLYWHENTNGSAANKWLRDQIITIAKRQKRRRDSSR